MIKIIENGMEFVMETNKSSKKICCERCRANQNCEVGGDVRRTCGHYNDTGLICTSATPIQPQGPRIYHAWDREDAKELVGKIVEAHNGLVTCAGPSGWYRTVLNAVSNTGAPFMAGKGQVLMIREIPTRLLTWAECQAMCPELEGVELVEVEK